MEDEILMGRLKKCIEFVAEQIEQNKVIPTLIAAASFPPYSTFEKGRFDSAIQSLFLQQIIGVINKIQAPQINNTQLVGTICKIREEDNEIVKFITMNAFYVDELNNGVWDGKPLKFWGVACLPSWDLPEGFWYFLTDKQNVYSWSVPIPESYSFKIPVQFEVIDAKNKKNK